MQSKPSKGLDSLQMENELPEVSCSLTPWSITMNARLDRFVSAFNRKGFGMIEHAFDFIDQVLATSALQEDMNPQQLNIGHGMKQIYTCPFKNL